MEELLDQAYEQFVARREGSTKQRKRAKRKHSEDGLLEVWFMCVSTDTLFVYTSGFLSLKPTVLSWPVIFMMHSYALNASDFPLGLTS